MRPTDMRLSTWKSKLSILWFTGEYRLSTVSGQLTDANILFRRLFREPE
jgi:hypothetical protein